MISVLRQEFPDRVIHSVGDAAYHGTPLLITGTTITTRLPANAALDAPAPPHTGKRCRPRRKGQPVGRPTDLAAGAAWATTTMSRYGRTDTVEIAAIDTIWYGAFGNTPGRTELVREVGEQKVLAIFTTDTDSPIEAIVARYAHRWPIETAIAAAKQTLGIGQARNRLQLAVERSVPFQFAVYSLVILWCARHGHHHDDLATRRAAQPWYRSKEEPAFEDMLIKLRRTLVAAQITGVAAAQPDPHENAYPEVASCWTVTAGASSPSLFWANRDFNAIARFSIPNQLRAASGRVAAPATAANANGFKKLSPHMTSNCCIGHP
jgi:hypothetical protein